jgi:hypothetical protein
MGIIRHHKHPNTGIRRLIKELKVATQQEVDNLTQEVQQIHDNLSTAKSNIQDRFAALEKVLEEAGKPVKDQVDITGLGEAIKSLDTPSQELEDLEPVQAQGATSAPETAAPTQEDGTAAPGDTTQSTAGENPEPAATDQPAGATDTAGEDAARAQV